MNKNIDDNENTNINSNKKNTKSKLVNFEYRPVPTIYSTVICFIILGFILLSLGIIILILSGLVKEFSIRYDDLPDCQKGFIPINNSVSNQSLTLDQINQIILKKDNLNNKECRIDFTLFEKFESPVMVYYELDNFYQNHRTFMKSLSVSQLKGQILNISDIEFDCDPIKTVEDLGNNKTYGGKELPLSAPANPCGLFAKAFFNDTYKLQTFEKTNIFINESNISWNSDKSRFISPLNSEQIQWINVTDEHFMIWMRPAATSNFRKLWGRVNTDMLAGNYSLTITNNYNVTGFNGKKSFIISTTTIFGGKNYFLGTLYIVVGAICLLCAAVFSIGYSNKVLEDKRKFN